MARKRRQDEERSMDSLMDAMTNVVGILLLILIVTSLGISSKVQQIISDLPQITEEQLTEMKASRDKTLDNLKKLKATYADAKAQAMDPEEAKQLALNLDKFEKENEDLAAKTSDLEELLAKSKELEPIKDEKEDRNTKAVLNLNKLEAALGAKPEVKAPPPREITLPDPRPADPEAFVYYVLCKNQKVYVIGEPYELMTKMRDIIDSNFTDLVYKGDEIGSYVYDVRSGTRKDDKGNPDYIRVKYEARTRRDQEALAYMKPVNVKTITKPEGTSLFNILMGGNESAQKSEKEWPVRRLRYDKNKIKQFFAKNAGKGDFTYIPEFPGDRVRLVLKANPNGGLSEDQFLSRGSPFVEMVQRASVNRRVILMYYVASDSFDTYLKARDYSTSKRVPAGWILWDADTINNLVPNKYREKISYDLHKLPESDYLKLAQFIGPKLTQRVNTQVTNFEKEMNTLLAATPKDLRGYANKAEYDASLKASRTQWGKQMSWDILDLYRAPLAASEADKNMEVAVQIHPPEILHIRTFLPRGAPGVPRPKPKPGGGAPPKPKGTGKPPLILD